MAACERGDLRRRRNQARRRRRTQARPAPAALPEAEPAWLSPEGFSAADDDAEMVVPPDAALDLLAVMPAFL